jgi:transcriptional regulator with XRE-family HTH domain
MKLSDKQLLKATMQRRKISIGTLARYAGCSKSMIGHLTSGHKTSCTPALAERIAEGLDVPLELLFVTRVSTPRSRSTRTRERVTA